MGKHKSVEFLKLPVHFCPLDSIFENSLLVLVDMDRLIKICVIILEFVCLVLLIEKCLFIYFIIDSRVLCYQWGLITILSLKLHIFFFFGYEYVYDRTLYNLDMYLNISFAILSYAKSTI